METTYKVAMQSPGGSSWLVLDSSSDKKRMQIALEWYRKAMLLKTFRLEKHTMEVIDV